MDTIVAGLESDGFYVKRFFYKNDPQVVFQKMGGRRTPLSDLVARFSSHRLLISGTGEELLNPDTTQPESYTRVFNRWKDRAILTPRSPRKWGMCEVALAWDFIVLPATLEAIMALTDYFDHPSGYDLKNWVTVDPEAGLFAKDAPETSEGLRRWLGDEDTFEWLCACAMYPELHWILTLRLAVLMNHPMREDSLLRLIRLPWFYNGIMPDNLRLSLIAELDHGGNSRYFRSFAVRSRYDE